MAEKNNRPDLRKVRGSLDPFNQALYDQQAGEGPLSHVQTRDPDPKPPYEPAHEPEGHGEIRWNGEGGR